MDLFNYSRRESSEVNIGATPLGGNNPIRIQSMTNTVTMDTEACVEQAKRIIDAGGEYVRLTTQGVREAENLKNINIGLRSQGYDTPLVADVHFNPKVADVAAQYAEKVRINPGNYVDPGRTFRKLEYTDEEYAQEIEKIRARFIPFLNICKENHTAIRIGVNHGSLSDRDLKIPGRELKGVYFALELLSQQNRILAGMEFSKDELVNCKGKDVLVIGGGDTGSDCIGTAHRQGCKSVTQIEIMPKPVEGPEDPKNPWPNWPRTLKTTSSHEEGCTRRWNINSLEFLGKNGKLTGVKVQPIDWKPNPEGGRPLMVEAGEPEIIKAEAVFLAMGFLKPQQPEFAENVFVAGDAANGASLVVRAMASGRKIAAQVDKFLNK